MLPLKYMQVLILAKKVQILVRTILYTHVEKSHYWKKGLFTGEKYMVFFNSIY